MVAQEIQSFDKKQLRPKKTKITDEEPVMTKPENNKSQKSEQSVTADLPNAEAGKPAPVKSQIISPEQPVNTEPVVLENLIIAEEINAAPKTEPNAPKHGGL